ncbi:helix-turn-helix protein [Actinocorallia herbida]|uniref:Helix-turn-helix protein n=1 Tax=Actinocorallia herbida TaxID=58109 RepID=A0A3N1CVD9_9ACTN|nr:helix-turn-helix domain-containing protein [Actinocorallia herbida]ROO85269.1 helix-turn-helix protein [Actinocorallia herbida]
MENARPTARSRDLPEHPVRVALLGLLRRDGVVTATGAARELGGSTGLYSFHLRRLAEFRLVEEVHGGKGRVRPWRLVDPAGEGPPPAGRDEVPTDAELSAVNRGLEDESYRHWLATRDTAPERWRHDEVFSQVVHLTPEELAGMADVIRALIAQYRHRDDRPSARPPGTEAVAVVARLFPLL